MLKISIDLDPASGRPTQRLGKIEIVNMDREQGNNDLYEVRLWKDDEEEHDLIGSIKFWHNRSDDLTICLQKGINALVEHKILYVRRIPEEAYYKETKKDGKEWEFVTWELVKAYHTEREVQKFGEFMVGQTGMMIKDGKTGIYPCDYERWLNQNMPTKQAWWDWD